MTTAATWLATLKSALESLEQAARSNQPAAIQALEHATATLTRLEADVAALPPAERDALAPHLQQASTHISTVATTLAHASEATGAELSRQRSRAAAFKSYGSTGK